MMGYKHVTPRKPKTCDRCHQTIAAFDEAYKQGVRYYHGGCVVRRQNHFKRRLLEMNVGKA